MSEKEKVKQKKIRASKDAKPKFYNRITNQVIALNVVILITFSLTIVFIQKSVNTMMDTVNGINSMTTSMQEAAGNVKADSQKLNLAVSTALVSYSFEQKVDASALDDVKATGEELMSSLDTLQSSFSTVGNKEAAEGLGQMKENAETLIEAATVATEGIVSGDMSEAWGVLSGGYQEATTNISGGIDSLTADVNEIMRVWGPSNVGTGEVSFEGMVYNKMKENLPGTIFFMKYALENKNYFTLKVLNNNKYVSADEYGMSQLRANRDSTGTWEHYFMYNNGDGTFAIQSRANNKFLCAVFDDDKAPIIPRSNTIQDWEKFYVEYISNDIVDIKTYINGKYVKNEDTWVRAVGTEVEDATKFEIKYLQ